ncbi:glycosyltransferase [Paenibacillus sp. P26]|nr:glycosyltransferase [Paenibacillus sp. P26]
MSAAPPGFPQLYGWSFYVTQHFRHDRLFLKRLNSMGSHTLERWLEQERPDAVIHTFPAPVVPGFRKRNGLPPASYTIVTDFVLHPRWIRSGVDKYYVATDDLKPALTQRGVPAGNIRTTGIPLRSMFEEPADPAVLRARYGIHPSRRVVCVMAGAYGVLNQVGRLGEALLAFDDMEVVFICGKNTPLRQQIEALLGGHPRVHVFGYVQAIQEIMAFSSCLITKAGGITLAEAIAMSLPVIVFRPLPGQEKENARYLAGKGAVEIVYRPEELAERIRGAPGPRTTGAEQRGHPGPAQALCGRCGSTGHMERYPPAGGRDKAARLTAAIVKGGRASRCYANGYPIGDLFSS